MDGLGMAGFVGLRIISSAVSKHSEICRARLQYQAEIALDIMHSVPAELPECCGRGESHPRRRTRRQAGNERSPSSPPAGDSHPSTRTPQVFDKLHYSYYSCYCSSYGHNGS